MDINSRIVLICKVLALPREERGKREKNKKKLESARVLVKCVSARKGRVVTKTPNTNPRHIPNYSGSSNKQYQILCGNENDELVSSTS